MKKKRKGKVPPHLKKYLFKKKKKARTHHKEAHVAKRKSKSKGGKRRHGGGGRRRSHRRSHRGGHHGIVGGYRDDIEHVVGGAIFGAVEKKMKADDSFFLNKLPAPIDAIGRTGNLSVALYLASYVLPGKFKSYARKGAKIGASITTYQLMRKGEAFKAGKEFFTISGFEDADEHYIDGPDADALADEMSGHRAQGTLTFDAHVDDDEHDEQHVPAPVDAHADGVQG